jgi:hypothetical protein
MKINNYNKNILFEDKEEEDYYYRADSQFLFAICKSCLWSATLLFKIWKADRHIPYCCPVCFKYTISVIPLVKDDI